jgi:hypothetical protein
MSDVAFRQLVPYADLLGYSRGDNFYGWLAGAPQACREVLAGVLPEGADCYQSYECASGNCHDPIPVSCNGAGNCGVRMACPGVCARTLQQGEACTGDYGVLRRPPL